MLQQRRTRVWRGSSLRGSVEQTVQTESASETLPWERDSGRCAFHGREGRFQETGRLEFHHVVPYAAGGETSVENLELRCRAHNALEAERWFGGLPLVRERCAAWGEIAPARSGPS